MKHRFESDPEIRKRLVDYGILSAKACPGPGLRRPDCGELLENWRVCSGRMGTLRSQVKVWIVDREKNKVHHFFAFLIS
jgi:hypothetical protein